MPRRRLINGVLQSFLGTFSSRYSDFNGYWLFGFLVGGPDLVTIDLLAPLDSHVPATPIESAKAIAAQRFNDQIEKCGVPTHWIAEARLDLQFPKGVSAKPNSGAARPVVELMIAVSVKSDLGRTYLRGVLLEVSPHDPRFETRSARAA